MNAADPLVVRLDELLRAAAKLPVCDGAAKLHALLARVEDLIEQRQDPTSSIESLARAATEALDRDPWVQFERAAERLRSALPTAAAPGVTLAVPATPPA